MNSLKILEKTQFLAELKALPGMIQILPPEERLSCSEVPAGIPRAALTEISGPAGGGKTEFTLRFFKQNENASKLWPIAWIESPFTFYPVALEKCGLPSDRFWFVNLEGFEDPLPVVLQTIRSQAFPVVLWSTESFTHTEVQLRRLQLACKQSGVTLLLLSPTPTLKSHWPISLQLHVHRDVQGRAVILDRSQLEFDEKPSTGHSTFESPRVVSLHGGRNE